MVTAFAIARTDRRALGWLIDSEEQVIIVLWPDSRMALLKNSDRLPVLDDIPLDLTVEQVFNWVRSR